LVIGIIGCGGSKSSSDAEDKDIVLGEDYREKEGDKFTYASTYSYTFSNGETRNISAEYTSSYKKVDEIPAKYSYSNDIEAPYLLATTRQDGKIINLCYIGSSGETIIDDGLDMDGYTSIDHITSSGEGGFKGLYIGKEIHYKSNEPIFNSNSGEEIGYTEIDIECKVINKEKVTVSSGIFDTLKLNCNYTWARSKDGEYDTTTGQKSIWVDINNVMSVKTTFYNVDMKSHKYDTNILFSSVTELKDYHILSTSSNKIVMKNNLFENFKAYNY